MGSLHIPGCVASPSREPEGQLAAAAGAQMPQQENVSDRMERCNYSSSRGCWGEAGWARHQLGALGPQLAGPACRGLARSRAQVPRAVG